MEQSITARLGCVQGQIHVARARLKASHEQAQVELAAAQAELVAVLNEGRRKVPLGQIRAPGDQSIGDRLDHIQAEVQRQSELKAAWDEVRAGWDEVQAAWEEVVTDTQVKATAWAPARFLQVPANTTQTLFHLPQILMHVAWLQARSAQIQASTAEAQLKALQVQGEDQPKDARKPAQAQVVSGPFLKQVYEQVAAAVHRILVLALQGLERAKQAQRLPVLSQLARAVHGQVEVALRRILAKAVRAVAAADRVELAEALCSQVEKAVQDVIVKAERDWGRPRGGRAKRERGLGWSPARWRSRAVTGKVGAQEGWPGEEGCLEEEESSGGAEAGEPRWG
ncbi:unnamed protein product [Eretmochelys imbricata]